MFNQRFTKTVTASIIATFCAATIGSPTASAEVVSSALAAAPDSSRIEDGKCDVGEFCLFYNSIERGLGSVHDFPWQMGYLGDSFFISPGAGQGRSVDNDAAAYWNRTDQTVFVYNRDRFETLNGNYNGRFGWIPPGRKGNFSAGYKNQVSSFTCPGCVWAY